MNMFIGVLVLFFVLEVKCQDTEQMSYIGTAYVSSPMCNGTYRVSGSFESGKSPEDENQFTAAIEGDFQAINSFIAIELDDDASIKLVRILISTQISTLRFIKINRY